MYINLLKECLLDSIYGSIVIRGPNKKKKHLKTILIMVTIGLTELIL